MNTPQPFFDLLNNSHKLIGVFGARMSMCYSCVRACPIPVVMHYVVSRFINIALTRTASANIDLNKRCEQTHFHTLSLGGGRMNEGTTQSKYTEG